MEPFSWRERCRRAKTPGGRQKPNGRVSLLFLSASPSATRRHRAREGCYPKRVLADKIYRNRANLSYCKERGIRLSGPALGRPRKDAVVDRKLEYTDICDRVEVERKFSLAKRKSLIYGAFRG